MKFTMKDYSKNKKKGNSAFITRLIAVTKVELSKLFERVYRNKVTLRIFILIQVKVIGSLLQIIIDVV